MVKIQENYGQFTLTIPHDIVRLVQLKKGEKVTVITDQFNRDIIVRRR